MARGDAARPRRRPWVRPGRGPAENDPDAGAAAAPSLAETASPEAVAGPDVLADSPAGRPARARQPGQAPREQARPAEAALAWREPEVEWTAAQRPWPAMPVPRAGPKALARARPAPRFAPWAFGLRLRVPAWMAPPAVMQLRRQARLLPGQAAPPDPRLSEPALPLVRPAPAAWSVPLEQVGRAAQAGRPGALLPERWAPAPG